MTYKRLVGTLLQYSGLTNNGTITIPEDFVLDKVELVTVSGSGSIGLGTTAGTKESATLTFADAATDGGTVTVGGVEIEISAESDTGVAVAAEVYAGLIADETFMASNTVSLDGAVITVVAKAEGDTTNLTFVDTDTTGVNGTVVIVAGTTAAEVATAGSIGAVGASAFLTVAKNVLSKGDIVKVNGADAVVNVNLYGSAIRQ